MASLAEELKLLSLPAPGKINLDNFEDDLTRARVISKGDVYENDSETEATTRSNLRKKAAILLADEDLRYAGKTISRKQQLKLREDSTDDFLKELSDNDDSTSEYKNGQDLQVMLEGKYEFHESSSDQSENEDSIVVENERGENYEKLEEDESEEDNNEEDESEVEDQEEMSEQDAELDNEDVEDYEVKKQESGKYEGVKKFSDSDKDEVEKGQAVVHQIGLWDSLLENRIRLQKMLVEVNKMPQYNMLNRMKENGGNQIKRELNNTQELLTNLLHNLLILQQTLFEKNSDTVRILLEESKANDSDEDIPSDDEAHMSEDKKEKKLNDCDEPTLKLARKRKQSMPVDEYSGYIVKRHAAFEHFRDATIKKWNEKTRLASGKVSNKSFNSFDRSTLNQIKQILSNRDRLIKRTQLKRSSYRVLGKTQVKEKDDEEERDIHLKDFDSEIFDDDDFYHQLLREFIERKSNVDSNDPIAMGRQWLEIQRLRNKVKRKVDTKASKGRRLRYDVHTKLVSFMAPQNRGTMTDSSRNELFSSLFGQRQPQETGDINLFS